MCSRFQFPSGNVTTSYTRSACRRQTRGPPLAGRPAGGSGGRGALSEGRTRPRAPSAGSALVLFPPVPSPPLAPPPSVLAGHASRGRWALTKPKITGVSGGREAVAQRGHRPCVCVCPACCCHTSCHHCCCSVAASAIGAKDCPCARPRRPPRSLR